MDLALQRLLTERKYFLIQSNTKEGYYVGTHHPITSSGTWYQVVNLRKQTMVTSTWYQVPSSHHQFVVPGTGLLYGPLNSGT